MTELYEIVKSIFQNGTDWITMGLYESAQLVFNNGFFNVVFSLSILWIGFMIMFRKLSSEETAHKLIWLIVVFSIVKMTIFNSDMYETTVSLLNTPRDMFITLIHNFVSDIDKNASIKNIINNVSIAIDQLGTYFLNQAGWSNISSFFYGAVIYLSGGFLLLVILLTSVFSIFLSDVLLSLMPFILPFLAWKKSEYMFFAWVKAYISVSIYAPFTLLFGLIAVQTTEFTMRVTHLIQADMKQNIMYLFALIIVQALTALAIFKIPNIINQIIGSSNEGSSLTSGVGTVSAGGAIISTVSKYTGMKFANNVGSKVAKKAGSKIAKDVISKVTMR